MHKTTGRIFGAVVGLAVIVIWLNLFQGAFEVKIGAFELHMSERAVALAQTAAGTAVSPGSVDVTKFAGLSASSTNVSLSGSLMTVNASGTGTFAVGMTVSGTGLSGQTIISLGTYAGATGTLNLSGSATTENNETVTGSDTSPCAKVTSAAIAFQAAHANGGTIDARGFTGTITCGGPMFGTFTWPAPPFYADVYIAQGATWPTQQAWVAPSNGRIILEPLPLDQFNVLAYGATGNGSTDDTNAIQAAENAVEAVIPLCAGSSHSCGGTLLFPSGSYKIATGPVYISGSTGSAYAGSKWIGLSGQLSMNESVTLPYPGATIWNQSSAPAVEVNGGTGSQNQFSSSFYDIQFIGNARTQDCLYILNTNNGHISHSGFRRCGKGIHFGGASDDSLWTIDGASMFAGNVNDIACDASAAAGCSFAAIGNNFESTSADNVASDIHILIPDNGSSSQNLAAQRIIGNKFDCGFPSTTGGIVTGGFLVTIMGNAFENCQVIMPETTLGTGNNGRDLQIVGNSFSGGGGANGGSSFTCNLTSGSASVSGCSPSLTGASPPVTVGMQVCVSAGGAGLPVGNTWAAGGANTSGTSTNANLMTSGGIYVTGSLTSTGFTMSVKASASETPATVFFINPPIAFPYGAPPAPNTGATFGYPVTVVGNTYVNIGQCPDNVHWNPGN